MSNAAQIPNAIGAKALSPLARVQKGRQEQPIRLICMGLEGVGKSTFAAGAPDPIFLTTEAGTAHLDIARLPQPQSWSDVLSSVDALRTEKHDYKTLVIDSVTGLEPILFAKVCADNGWKDIEAAGYGKGYVAALDQWRQLLRELEQIWTVRRMNIVIVAHTMVKAFRNPDGEDFERYQMALNDKAAGLLRQWADAVIFARHEAFTKVDSKTKRAKGYSTGARVMHTNWSAAFDAKNRYGLPDELPLSWQDFAAAIQSADDRAKDLVEQIGKLAADLDDPKIAKFSAEYVDKNRSNADKLAELVNRLNVKLDEKNTKENGT